MKKAAGRLLLFVSTHVSDSVVLPALRELSPDDLSTIRYILENMALMRVITLQTCEIYIYIYISVCRDTLQAEMNIINIEANNKKNFLGKCQSLHLSIEDILSRQGMQR